MADITITTTAIDHVVLYVRDVARSKAFYRDVLGMTVRSDSDSHAFMRVGDNLIGLFQAEDEDALASGGQLNHLAFSIEAGSYEDVKAALEDHGLAVSGRRGDPRCLYFDDPDGHQLQLLAPDGD